jgi:bifunctional DNase/RNase
VPLSYDVGTGYLPSRTARLAERALVIQVRIASLAVDPRSNQPVIILRPLDEEPGPSRVLPIWIGQPEATAILLALEDVDLPRPLTHDLMRDLLQTLNADVERVEITRVQEGTFYAALIIRAGERSLSVDARPSDSIALAVRMGAPLFVAESVMTSAAVSDDSGEIDEEAELQAFREFLEHVDPEDFQG